MLNILFMGSDILTWESWDIFGWKLHPSPPALDAAGALV